MHVIAHDRETNHINAEVVGEKLESLHEPSPARPIVDERKSSHAA